MTIMQQLNSKMLQENSYEVIDESMVVTRRIEDSRSFKIENNEFEQVEEFKYFEVTKIVYMRK